MSRDRLRGSDLRSPHHGVRSPVPLLGVEQAAQDALPVLPPAHAFSHVTAARLLGMPWPTQWDPEEPVHVVTPSGRFHLERPGLVSHRGLERRGTTVLSSGLTSTDDLHTWADAAAVLTVDQLIAAGDWVLRPRSTRTLADLAGALQRRMRGVRSARLALLEIRPGSASPMETRTRLQLVRGGLPEPELNVTLSDEGGWLGVVDLFWRRWRLIAEYDGRHHVERQRTWERDVARERAFRDAGFGYERLISGNVNGPAPDAVAIVRRALVRAGWRPGLT
ncbi:hypothetical protein ADJ73_06900 [Arsenicicoccus sp. oral taxon 190]|nr:hypothetical protein ADJ73_06900 [Arsenicicoccus sp. oral taxon 190]